MSSVMPPLSGAERSPARRHSWICSGLASGPVRTIGGSVLSHEASMFASYANTEYAAACLSADSTDMTIASESIHGDRLAR